VHSRGKLSGRGLVVYDDVFVVHRRHLVLHTLCSSARDSAASVIQRQLGVREAITRWLVASETCDGVCCWFVPESVLVFFFWGGGGGTAPPAEIGQRVHLCLRLVVRIGQLLVAAREPAGVQAYTNGLMTSRRSSGVRIKCGGLRVLRWIPDRTWCERSAFE
jgi:hypothetical protein